MVLLTSSQVSVAISSAVVFSFTAALFLSGYAIQQRTVRNLRAAIRPNPTPQLILPDRFRHDTTELEDGTIVMLDEYNRPVRLKAGRISLGRAGPDEFNAADAARTLDINLIDGEGLGGQTVEITIQQTLADGEDLNQRRQKVIAPVDGEPIAARDRDSALERASHHSPTQPAAGSEPVQAQTQLAPWEVRREDMPEADETDTEGSGQDGAEPMSRAERRRKIKEEIQKLSLGDTPLYYQRRLW